MLTESQLHKAFDFYAALQKVKEKFEFYSHDNFDLADGLNCKKSAEQITEMIDNMQREIALKAGTDLFLYINDEKKEKSPIFNRFFDRIFRRK